MNIRIPPRIGTTLLATWLIATGAIPLLGITNAGLPVVMSLLAIAAGIFLLRRP